jgi:hypothetical protein
MYLKVSFEPSPERIEFIKQKQKVTSKWSEEVEGEQDGKQTIC